MGQYVSWVPTPGKHPEILNEKRAKELIKEAVLECSASLMLKCTPAPTSKGGATRSAAQRKKGSNLKRSGKGGKSGGDRKLGRRGHAAGS